MPETANLIATPVAPLPRSTARSTESTVEPSFEALAQAVDEAAAAVAQLDEAPREVANELRAAIEAAHKAGLVTIVRRLRADDTGRALLFELVDDPLIRMLFSLHAIIKTVTPPGVGAAGEHTAGGHSEHEQEHAGCGCGGGSGGPKQSQAIIPLSAVRRRDALDIWPGGGA
jgi:hypothetical protein